MTDLDLLLERNSHFAAEGRWREATIRGRFAVYVITCLDPRVDPHAFLELALGDATVVRNVGGRVSPAVLDDLAYIGYLQRTIVPGGPQFEVVIIHHNQCGTHYLTDPDFRAGFAELVHADDDVVAARAVVDPAVSVRADVDKVLADTSLPRTITVSGRTYDVTTGLVTTVVPATAMPALTTT